MAPSLPGCQQHPKRCSTSSTQASPKQRRGSFDMAPSLPTRQRSDREIENNKTISSSSNHEVHDIKQQHRDHHKLSQQQHQEEEAINYLINLGAATNSMEALQLLKDLTVDLKKQLEILAPSSIFRLNMELLFC